jgi:hypothetical protein
MTVAASVGVAYMFRLSSCKKKELYQPFFNLSSAIPFVKHDPNPPLIPLYERGKQEETADCRGAYAPRNDFFIFVFSLATDH